MGQPTIPVNEGAAEAEGAAGTHELEKLLAQGLSVHEPAEVSAKIDGVRIGVLVGLQDLCVPLVAFPGQAGSAAVAGRTSVELRGEHIGGEVVLAFEDADPARPIVIGCIQKAVAWPLGKAPAQVEVDADGRRLTLAAKDQLVLKCGKASVTLTAAGKVLIQGTYVSQRSSGVMRVKGGSVQIN